MANVSSSNGLEKHPKLRFKGFSEPWEHVKLSDFVSRVTRKNSDNQTDIPLTISSKDGLINQNEFFSKQVASKDMSGYYLLQRGEFAYNKSYSVGFDFGSIKRLEKYNQGALSTLYICFALDRFDSDFIKHYFDSLKWYREIYMISAEGARNHGLLNVPTEDFFATLHTLPMDTAEQRKIAEFLDLLTSKIEKQQALVDNLKKYKRGVMREIFETKTLFSSHHYSLVQLGNECRFFSGGTPQSGNSKYYGGSIPFIRSGEVHKSITELTLTEEGLNNSSAKMVEVGDLIMALYGATSGEVDISKISGAINQAILCIRPNTINRHYLKFLFECKKEDILKTYLQGGQGNLSAEIIKKLCFESPLPSEQQETVDFLVALENKISLEDSKLEKLFSVRNGLLQQLFI